MSIEICDHFFQNCVGIYGPDLALKIYHATNKYNFIRIADDGVVELYADNHILSSLRWCEGYFEESILNCVGGRGRAWSLDFGAWMHFALEVFYAAHSKNWEGYSLTQLILDVQKYWNELKMDEFANDPRYKKIGGWPGAALIISEYYTVYRNDRLRIVGTELGFGKNKEVPILDNHTLLQWAPFRAYYCGRLDYIIDNGSILGPMDTKTTSRFDGTESNDFKPHEGMEGYVYSCRQLMKEAAMTGKLPTTMIINHVSLQACKNPFERFKRSFVSFTPEQLEAWRLRQIKSFSRLYDIIVGERPVDWNTNLCTQMYFHDCPYRQIHEATPSARQSIMQTFYTIRPQWSPYDQEESIKEAAKNE